MSIFRKYCVPCDNAGCGRCINWSSRKNRVRQHKNSLDEFRLQDQQDKEQELTRRQELDEKQKDYYKSCNSFEQDKINRSKEFFKSYDETMDYHFWIQQQIELYKDNSEFQYNLLLCTGINIIPK